MKTLILSNPFLAAAIILYAAATLWYYFKGKPLVGTLMLLYAGASLIILLMGHQGGSS